MAGISRQDDETVATSSGLEIPAAAQATFEQLVALLRESCRDLPMEAEPGDFLVALERNALAEDQG